MDNAVFLLRNHEKTHLLNWVCCAQTMLVLSNSKPRKYIVTSQLTSNMTKQQLALWPMLIEQFAIKTGLQFDTFHGHSVYLPIIVTNVVVLSSCFSILHEYSPLSSISQSFMVSRQIPDISLAVSYLSPSYVTWETNLYIYIAIYSNETTMSSFTHFKFVYQTLLFNLSKIYFTSIAYNGIFIYN